MSNVNPEEARRQHDAAADASRDDTGDGVAGDDAPGEGMGVGPTNRELDIERRGNGSWNKIWLLAILGLVLAFVVVSIIGLITRLL